MKKLILLFAIGISFCACQNQKEKPVEQASQPEKEVVGDAALRLLSGNCLACHSPNAQQPSRIAPVLPAIKKAYLEAHPNKEEFVKAMIDFIAQPTQENALMKDAVKQFGVMPKMSFTDEQVRMIAEFLYENDLEKADWHKKQAQATSPSTQNIEEITLQMATQTKSVLGKNLLEAINSKGTAHAISFCNTRAYPLTDSMAIALKASIKRVSDQPRNPNNQANAQELAYIAKAKESLQKGEKIAPQILKENGKVTAYYPIETNKMCLQCHGTPKKDILENSLAQIQKLYPQDKATGYQENQLRGIWVINLQQ